MTQPGIGAPSKITKALMYFFPFNLTMAHAVIASKSCSSRKPTTQRKQNKWLAEDQSKVTK